MIHCWARTESVATVSTVNSVINVIGRGENTIRGAMARTRNLRGTTHGAVRHRLVAFFAVLAVLVTGGTIATNGDAAWAKDYPSWEDVNEARNDAAVAEVEVARIIQLLAELQSEAARTQADAEAKGVIWREADQKFQEAAARAATLQEQADAANAVATASEQRAGQMAAQLVRSSAGDITTNLFINSGDADNLLYGLGMSSKISEQANAIYERALLDKNTAQSLTDQADIARNELEQLKLVAEKAFAEAQAAATAAATALNEQRDNAARLNAQLIVLREKRVATEADYQAGVRERFGSGANLDVGEISASGWVKPVSGPITSSFGWRVAPKDGASTYHQGTDIGAGCGARIYAATAGTVVYAGWNGGYGNFVLIDHGNGVATAYGHIVNGGILVSYGQHVDIGQNIALVGTTGTSTGCHLHLEVRINGVATDAAVFLANQGIRLG